MFDPLLEELHTSIKFHGGKQIELPKHLAECSSKKDGKAKIKSWLWDISGFRRWRVTRLDAGNKLQVLNSVAYPNYHSDKPILGIDLLCFGSQSKLVAVLDFQPLVQDPNYFKRYFDGLKVLKNQFPEFNNDEEISLYDPKQYFSPWVLFCRGSVDQLEPLLPKVFNSFINCYWNLYCDDNHISSGMDANQVKKYHISYDKYSAKKDPAHSLFTGFFGQEWSDSFLQEFLFPLNKCESTL